MSDKRRNEKKAPRRGRGTIDGRATTTFANRLELGFCLDLRGPKDLLLIVCITCYELQFISHSLQMK
jgi:hypothetical protein